MKASLLAGVFVLSFVGISGAENQAIRGRAIGSQSGRFVMGQISDARQDQFVLDTQTGKVWNVQVDQNGSKVLVPVNYLEPGAAVKNPGSAESSESFSDYITRQKGR